MNPNFPDGLLEFSNMADAPHCPKCKRPMKLVDTLPAEGVHPALEAFRCDECNEKITVEAE
jgi:hypothetical protein